MRHRIILLIVAACVLAGFAGAAAADYVIRKEFSPVDDTPRWVDDEFVVVLKPAFKSGFDVQVDKRANRVRVSVASIQRLVDAHGVIGMRRQFAAAAAPELEAFYTVRLARGQDLDQAAAAFAADPAVDHVEKIGIHPLSANCATGTPHPANDTYYNNPPPTFNWPQWDLWDSKGIDAELAWTVETGDATVVVVAMDSGVKYTHKDLGGNNPPGPSDNSTDGNVWVNPFEVPGNGIDDEGNGFIDDVIGYDFVTGVTGCASGEDCSTIDNNPMDFNGHGTHTAGTMAAITNNARAVAGIAGGFGDGTTASPGNGCKIMCMRIGWSDAAGNGFVRMDFAAQAINYVVGMKQRGVNVAAINCSWGSSNSGGIAAALDAAMNNDILVVHAAGNSNSSLADYMGSRAEILNVAATDAAGLRASFSNYGSWVDIAAPGVAIISTYQVGTDPIPDYVAVLDGTSMAAPHCVGVAGLLESFSSSLTRADKFSLMVNNTCPAGSPNIGGILNAKKALDAIAPPCDVTANFTGSPTSGNVPLTVNFTDASTGPVTSWSWTFGDGGTSTAQNPSHIYSAAGTYTVSLTVTSATCNNTLTRTDYIMVTDPNAWVTLSSDDFEAGFGSYADGGADCSRYTGGTHAHQGVAAIDIQDNTASSLFSHTAAYNVTAYNTLEVSFWFKAVSMENGEDFWVQYFNGSTWVTVGDFNAGTDFVNNTFNNRVVTISRSLHNFPTNARIRFRCDASDNNDDVYIDEVVFRATTATTPSINSAPALASADPVPREYALEQNYPNPFNAGTVIPFTLSQGGEVQLVVYDILGRTVRRLAAGYHAEGPHTVAFDGRDELGNPLASGVYLYRLTADGHTQTRKMVLVK